MNMYSYLELNEFSAAMNNIDLSINDPLSWAVMKNKRKMATVLTKAHELATNINIDFALTDKEGVLVTEKGEFKYTKENLKERNSAAQELSNTKVEYEFYKSSEDKRGKTLSIDLQDLLQDKLW